MTSRALRVACLLLLMAVAGLAGLCGLVVYEGLRLSAPANRPVGPPPSDLGGARTVSFPSGSGSTIKAWWCPGAPGGGVVVLLPGLRGDRTGFLPRIGVLHQHGFGVLAIDFQASGESPGRHLTFGKLEALDAAAAVGFAMQQAPGERIGVLGTSLGAAAAVLSPKPLPVQAMVLESMYPDIDSALSNRLKVGLGPRFHFLTPVLARLFEWLMPPFLGGHVADLCPLCAVRTVTAPLLVISGTNDDRTPLTEAKAIYAAAPKPKQSWWVEGAWHQDLEAFGPEKYWSVVLPFLADHLRR